jgi:hypothetical protein
MFPLFSSCRTLFPADAYTRKNTPSCRPHTTCPCSLDEWIQEIQLSGAVAMPGVPWLFWLFWQRGRRVTFSARGRDCSGSLR